VERRWVKTGGRDENRWEIVGGLREGEKVLARGAVDAAAE
jgi:multidrug efflux pump subunit AcrA (membrane-fusion protein)